MLTEFQCTEENVPAIAANNTMTVLFSYYNICDNTKRKGQLEIERKIKDAAPEEKIYRTIHNIVLQQNHRQV